MKKCHCWQKEINGNVFSSRRQQFFGIVKEALQQHFKISIDKLLKHLSQTGSDLTDDDIRSHTCTHAHVHTHLVDIQFSLPPSLHTFTLSPHTLTHCRGLFFGDYMVPGAEPRIYDEVLDFAQLTTTMEK